MHFEFFLTVKRFCDLVWEPFFSHKCTCSKLTDIHQKVEIILSVLVLGCSSKLQASIKQCSFYFYRSAKLYGKNYTNFIKLLCSASTQSAPCL